MIRCERSDCGWQAVAPSAAAAREQYAAHLVEEHTETVDSDVPEGMVEVDLGDGEWRTVTVEEAKRLHEQSHADD